LRVSIGKWTCHCDGVPQSTNSNRSLNIANAVSVIVTRHRHAFQILSTVARLSLYNISAPEHPPKAPQSGFNTDHSPSLGHISNPDADELHTHRQTQPYLRNEPTAKVTSGEINGFFRHVFSQDITGNEANLNLSDLKYNPFQPRQAEVLLEGKLNRCIDSSSRSKFIGPYFVRSYTSMLVKTSFFPGRYTRRHPASIMTVVWISLLSLERYPFQ